MARGRHSITPPSVKGLMSSKGYLEVLFHFNTLDPMSVNQDHHNAGMRSYVRRSDSSLVDHLGDRSSDSLVDKLKKVLRVDSDEDTDTLHNKYKETAKDREEKLRMFEKQLNIKVAC